ncbi:MAG: LytTR family DNA-binding domain-containing protein [Bacteroidales bacterium]|nr:LytTR family DNA-binding domain-containing protein [Bacteroidales bacterium]
MKTVIIEDETIAAQALQKLINEIDAQIEVIAVLETIEESIDWFESHKMPELIFADIHLADGSSFAIFEQTDITCPVVFTTAYDEYALKAFEVNSIDYLLKPINKDDLERALNKFKTLTKPVNNKENVASLVTQLETLQKKYKTCFLIPERDKLIPLATNNIACIFIDLKTVKAISLDGRHYYMNQTLDELMGQLDPTVFFRANRQYIISRSSVKDISIWFGNKLSLNLTVEVPEKIIVSKARVSEFKTWFSE